MMQNERREWPVDQMRKWAEDEGQSVGWIGAQIGADRRTVAKVCKRYGIKWISRASRPGPANPAWKGGRSVDKDGYILVHAPEHPHAVNGRVREHRMVMERVLGRLLDRSEVVHHRNGDKQDNRPENLEVYASNAEHLRKELAGRCPKWSEDGKARTRAGRMNTPMPESAKETLRLKATGRKASPEARAKMSASQIRRHKP